VSPYRTGIVSMSIGFAYVVSAAPRPDGQPELLGGLLGALTFIVVQGVGVAFEALRVRGPAGVPHRWVVLAAFFLPRRNREPFLGDLLEDRDAMLNEWGVGRVRVELATVSQILIFFVSGWRLAITVVLAWIAGKLPRPG